MMVAQAPGRVTTAVTGTTEPTGDAMTLDPNRKPMPPEQWERVKEQVRENVRLIRLGRAKKPPQGLTSPLHRRSVHTDLSGV